MNEKHLLNTLTNYSLNARRMMLGQLLREMFRGVIAYGSLNGVNINQYQTWSDSSDLGSKLIGFYEKEVLDVISGTGKRYDYLVNLGAGDGYYGVGLVKKGIAGRSICFESNAKSQDTLRACAEANGVSDRVEILGIADEAFLQSDAMREIEPAKSLFIIDIEGGEFGILTKYALAQLRDAELIIELHGPFFASDPQIEVQLLTILGEFFDCRIFSTGARDPSAISELAQLSDTDRWLLCSEGRPYLMRWVHCKPRRQDGIPL